MWRQEGKYIKHFLPVLKDMPAKYIFEPWTVRLCPRRMPCVPIRFASGASANIPAPPSFNDCPRDQNNALYCRAVPFRTLTRPSDMYRSTSASGHRTMRTSARRAWPNHHQIPYLSQQVLKPVSGLLRPVYLPGCKQRDRRAHQPAPALPRSLLTTSGDRL